MENINSTTNRIARGNERYATKKEKLGFAVGDKVKINAGDVAGHYGKVIECMEYGNYLVQLSSGLIKSVAGRDLEMC